MTKVTIFCHLYQVLCTLFYRNGRLSSAMIPFDEKQKFVRMLRFWLNHPNRCNILAFFASKNNNPQLKGVSRFTERPKTKTKRI